MCHPFVAMRVRHRFGGRDVSNLCKTVPTSFPAVETHTYTGDLSIVGHALYASTAIHNTRQLENDGRVAFNDGESESSSSAPPTPQSGCTLDTLPSPRRTPVGARSTQAWTTNDSWRTIEGWSTGEGCSETAGVSVDGATRQVGKPLLLGDLAQQFHRQCNLRVCIDV
mmetsp:Transcript_29891/g.48070  ORF Transcript_29891/g.48070 Transcript_29891/m.48070 type:complete len:168 (+) Transcript_29891:1114-1617(+)